jgi:hypothetical protein
MVKKYGLEDLELLLADTLKIIHAHKGKDKNDISHEVIFLNRMVAHLVDQAVGIRRLKNATSEEQFEFVKNNYEKVKLGVQNAVGLAFQESMQRFSKNPDVEFYCLIKPVPAPISSETH